MLRLGALRRGVAEHLELVELVDAQDAAIVLAGRPRLASVARRPSGIPDGAVGEVEDLVRVIPGERDLARPRQIEVVGREVVDLIRVRAEEAGAGHDLGPHERRRDERLEARLDRRVEAEAHERELEPRAPAAQEVEARSRDLGAAGDVDRAGELADLDVVARREVECVRAADLADERPVVLAAGGDPVDHDVADPRDDRVERRLGIACRLLGRLDSRSEVLRLRDERRLLLLRRLRDELGMRVLLGPQRLERGERRAARRIRLDRVVDEAHLVSAGHL